MDTIMFYREVLCYESMSFCRIQSVLSVSINCYKFPALVYGLLQKREETSGLYMLLVLHMST